MNEESSGRADEDADDRPAGVSADVVDDGLADGSTRAVEDGTAPGGDLSLTDSGGAGPEGIEESSEAAEIVDLEWDDDLPVALGEETVVADGEEAAELEDGSAAADDDEWDEDPLSESRVARRNALPRRLESWRSRSASGAIATAIAMGLQQVFEPEKKRPAAVAEAPSDPYSDDDPVTVDYVPDDAEATRVHVKPWLLQKGDPA